MFSPAQRRFAELHSRLAWVNPFEPRYDELFDSVLQIELGLTRSPPHPLEIPNWPEMSELLRRVGGLLETAREKLASARLTEVGATSLALYDDLVTTWLYYRYGDNFRGAVEAGEQQKPLKFFQEFAAEMEHYVAFPQVRNSSLTNNAAHVFACCFQLRRAFPLIGDQIRGNSAPIARLRAAIWQSIFTHDLRLWGQLLYDRMHDIATLIVGPTGSGKELVARAIGLSRYIPFDPQRQQFTEHFAGAFHSLNLAAMPRDLIESEMFGHCAGAFTGAVKDHEGWFEKCRECHSVFLDEVGELGEEVQVKLLRVLQSREFQRVGETQTRHFKGKVIAATNRDLAAEMDTGRFRQDLYFRLGSDVVRTPSLREQLDDRPDELPDLVQLVAERCLGDRAQRQHIDRLRDQTVQWIEGTLETEDPYRWPGNFRELEQCVRSVMVRGEYYPPRLQAAPSAASQPTTLIEEPVLHRLFADMRAGTISYDDLLDHYCSLVFSQTGNVTRAARRLGKHRATIQSRVKPELVEMFRGQGP